MKMLSAQLSVNSILAKEEQYAVPVMVNDELMNVSVKSCAVWTKKESSIS